MNDTAELHQNRGGWRVSRIEVVQAGRAVEVEFTIDGRSPFRFRTRKFGVGGRNAKTAALARFAAHAGYGDVKLLFQYLSATPRSHEGDVFPDGPIGHETDDILPCLRGFFSTNTNS